MNILCLFIPSLFAVFLYKKLFDKKSSIDLILIYGIFAFFSNLILFAILIFISGIEYCLSLETSPLSFIVKVLIMNEFINILLFVLFAFIERKIGLSLKFDLDKNDENKN